MNKTMIAVLVATLVAPFALAEHSPTGTCDAGDAPSIGIREVEVAGRLFYVEDRGVTTGGTWIYEETNGIYVDGDSAHSLQRGGASAYVPDDADECVDDPLVIPDTLVF